MLDHAFTQGKKFYDAITAEKNAKFKIPDGVSLIRNVSYAIIENAKYPMFLDVYRDNTVSSDLPIIIYVHGGDFFMGRKDGDMAFCARLAQEGFVVFSVEYTLIPKAKNIFYQWDDLNTAMLYIDMNAGIYGGDLNNVFMVGDNAGANLIVYALAMKKNRRLAERAEIIPSSLDVNAVCLTRGMFQTTKFDLFGLLMRKRLWGKDYKRHRFANPCIPAIVDAMPPCALITGSNDPHRRYTEEFADALAERNIEHEKHIYMGNEGGYFTLFDPESRDGKWALERMLNFFRKHMRSEVVVDA